jgi:transposase
MGWDTVKQIDYEHLEQTLGPVDLSGVEAIVMNEFAMQKGHRYAIVILDSLTKQVF